MKRAGFTMIELIFVIGILGILAAVAIPKLAATRTDASVAKISQDASTLVGELGSYYTAQGTFKGKSTADITNIQLQAADADLQNNDTMVVPDENNNTCLTITFNNVDDGNITVSAPANPVGSVCKGVKTSTTNLQKTYNFGGSSVNWN
jgi:prepilin-type N-terminal cleavage/methylation domain-containing protein